MTRIALLYMILACLAADAQPITPVSSIGTYKSTVEVPARFKSQFPANRELTIPNNYTVSVFHIGGMQKPRFMSFDPNGVLHVSDMRSNGNGRIYALPDLNQDGIADTAIVVAGGFTGNHDVKFYKGNMYVTEPTRIWKCTDANNDGIYESKTVFIDNLPGGGNHITRTLVFDAVNSKAYVSIGSSCNVCRETDRAIIVQYNDDGSGRRVYATGVRNAVGMTLHPVTNMLWANNNGSDMQGNETPPEWIDLVRDGGFYGHPFAYAGPHWFNFNADADYMALKPITASDTALVAKMILPAAEVRAHAAPMAITFLNNSFPGAWNKGFITALRGSWNTTSPNRFRGYKVVYGQLSSDQDTSVDFISDFCEGFLIDTINRIYWGRPVGLATNTSGEVFISSDETNMFILRMAPVNTSGLHETDASCYVSIYPNPAAERVTIQTDNDETLYIYDVNGTLVYLGQTSGGNAEIDISDWPCGIYVIRTSRPGSKIVKLVKV